MSSDTTPGALEHLLTDTVRDVIDRSAYGDWRRIAAADAVALSFGFPDPDLFPEAGLADSVERVLTEEGEKALQYGGGEYTSALESFLTEQETDRGIDFDTHDLLVTNGATHAIDTVCRVFLEPGDTVLVEEPTFMGALGVFWNFGVDTVGVPVDDDGLDVAELESILETRRARGTPTSKLLYTIPDFHNPTGTTLSRERRERVLELAETYDFAVLEDGAYSDLWFEETPPPALAALDERGRVVRVGTFSKTVAPGVRLGWLTAPERVTKAARSVAAGGSNTFTRSVVGHHCEVGRFDSLVPELRATYAERCAHMLDELDANMPAGVTWRVPNGGFFIWLSLPEDVHTGELLEPAMKHGVTFLPGSMFYAGDGGTNELRLSFTYVKKSEITAGIESLAASIESVESSTESLEASTEASIEKD